MSKSKLQNGSGWIVLLAITFSLGSAIIPSLVCAPAGLAAPANWYDNETTFLDRGKRNYNSGQFDQALKDLSECIRLNPNRADVYYWRSLTYSALHQNDQAMGDLDAAIRLDPHSAIVFLNRGLIYSNQGKHEAAIADFDQALKLDAGLSEARQNRDFCVQEMAKVKVAEQKAKGQADQAAIVASGGSVLSVADGNTAGGASSGSAVSGNTSVTSSSSSSGSSYTPYVGKGNAKLIAMQKEQKALEARLSREQAGGGQAAAERARLEAKKIELAEIQEKTKQDRLELERIKLEKQESKKLAMAKSPVVQPAIETIPATAKGGHPAKGAPANVELSQAGKIEAEGDALEIVNRPVRDKWALIIGISEFKDTKLNLHYPAKDAKDFYNFLVNEGNFAKDHVKLLTNAQATRASILSELGDKWLPHVANPDDLVLIYISSHGSPSEMDVVGVNYLLAYDTDVDNLLASGLPMQDLSSVIKTRVHSDRVVVVLDACHSGAAETGGKGLTRSINVDAEAVSQGTGQLVISSSSPTQVSWESKNYENSVFTRCLIDSLRKNGNATTLGEAFESMRDKVQQQVLTERGVLQTPVLKSKWKGSALRISTPPAAPRVGI
jgi:tetratricopeptide (TPR) repeat protein